ncbi:MAG: hypothetical protein HOP12_15960 [Candidatus Eisenbacteria bacterium]|uniref:PEP-CTERM sorting domain-containing protein n=1 Tax=Eiseniibacteriota bacterium TaxID=2212470 RepID=A0A849SWB0_UNCEI|nr:hypothetical protein [Candidatus Eisenbacteria bacterium]
MKPCFVPTASALLLAATLLTPGLAGAVNLVPNPSFETIASCPLGFGSLFVATPWDAPTAGTSDALNACAVFGPFAPGVPYNALGNQVANTGVGYAGLIPYSAAPDYREYLQAPLNSPLVASATYAVSFYVSLADTCNVAVDRLGAYFPVGPVGPLVTNTTLLVTPQFETPANTFLNDKTNWILVSGTFVAAGGESHIVIGSFRDDASTNLEPQPENWPGAYYYIDDVTVELMPAAVDQACCLPDATCTLLTPGECTLSGGTPMGAETGCNPNPCSPVPTRKSSWGALKSIYR